MVNKKKTAKLCFFCSGVFFLSFLTNCAYFGQAKVKEKKPAIITISQGSAVPQKTLKVETKNISMARTLKADEQGEYILGSGDVIEISVLHHDELTKEVTVSPTGKMMYHYIGDIQVGGLNIFQLRDEIRRKLVKFIKQPDVTLRITDYKSHKVFVVGQVNNPGVYRMQDNPTLMEGLSMAGGITGDAYLEGAYLVRNGKMLVVNFYDLVKKGNVAENIFLKPDDIIFIPNKHDRKVYVLGEVKNPTVVLLEDHLNLLQAITSAGGFTRNANPSTVFLMRGNLSKPQVMQIDVERILTKGEMAANIPLEYGDIIYVASSLWADVDSFFQHISIILNPIVNLERGIVLEPLVESVFNGENVRRNIVISQ